jgi:hypothetical protein
MASSMMALNVAKVLWLGLFTWACVSTLMRAVRNRKIE